MRELLLTPTPLFRKLRQLLVLSTLFSLPLTALGATETVTRTITFNEVVAATGTGIHNSSFPVSMTDQIVGGSSTSTTGSVTILDDYNVVGSYSCNANGAVFTLGSNAVVSKYFTIEIPGTYPAVPSQVTLKVAYSNSGTGENKIQVGDYGNGQQDANVPQSGEPVINFYNYYHPYRSHETSLTETTLTYTGNNQSGLGTNRDSAKPLYIYVFLDGNATFTIKEVTITYDREDYGITVAGTPVKSDNVSNILADGANNGKVTFTPAATVNDPNVLTLNGANIDFSTDDVIKSTISAPLNINLLGVNTISCNGHYAFNVSNDLIFQTSGTTSGQLTISNTSGVDPQNFYSCTGTVSYENSLAATSNGTNSVVISKLLYELYIDGTQVTSGNASDVLTGTANAGKVSYNAADNILSLNEASLTGIRTEISGLKINLIGANTIVASDSSAIQRAIPGNNDSGTAISLSFNGTGNLTITKKLITDPYYYASINDHITVTYNDGLVSEDGVSTTRISKGYSLTVAGTTITELNSPDVFGDSKVSFTPAATASDPNTLTLNNASINGTIVNELSNLTIVFEGDNELTGTSGYITSTNNAAPLTLKGGTGTSTLSLDNTVGITAISGFASLTYDGAYLTASRGCRYVTGTNPGIKDIKGGIVQPITITTDEYYPLWVYNHQVSSTNYGNVLGNGKVSYSATDHKLTLEDVDISNSNVIESELSDYLIIALKGNNSLVVNTGNNSPIMSGYDTATLTFQKDGTSDCRLDIGFYGVVLSSPIITNFASVSYTGLNFISKTGTTLNGTTTYDATLSSATIYPLWVGGTLVTEKTTSGTDATSGNTIWEYNANSNTLTLTNYNNTYYDGHAFISNMANLNVYLVGANTVSPYFQTSTDKAFYTTYTNATLTFSTDENNKGTLDASGFNTFCEGFRDVNGIYCNNGLGYYPGTREIKAKATPTISFNKRQQTGDNTPGDETGVFVGSETLTTTYGSTFYAPKPTFNNGYILNDSTRFEYSYSVDGVVEYPNNGEDANNPGKIRYGEISLLKAGTVTITCSFPGNMQNNPCSASYTLQVNKADAQVFEYEVAGQKITAANGYIDVDGTTSKWGTPQVSGAEPTLSKPNDATSITYGSSDNNVATVSTTGAVTPKGPGTAIISATLKDDERYNDSTATYTLIVMAPATVSFANATASILNTETYTQAATTIPEGSSITYSTNNTNGNVSVNGNGEVTISNLFCGTVTITATVTSVPDANPQCYYVLSNNAAFQASYTLTVSKIFNDVTFADGQNYATYYNGSDDMTVPEELTAYLVTGTSGNSVVTYQINYLPKNVPLLLEKSATAGSTLTNTTYSGTGLTDAEKNSNLLQHAEGNLPVANITGGTPYVLYKNEFVKATGTISADHCYMLITNNAPTRGFYSIGDGNDDSTAIEGIEFENEEVSDEWYDLQGRRIQKPTKAGLYIVNGKKVVINNK